MKTRKVKILAVAVCSLALMAMAGPANAVVVFSGPGSFAAGYTTPVVVAPVGGPLTYVNGDAQPHNVIAFEDFLSKKVAKKTPWCKGYAKGECPIFWSKTVTLGGQTPVEGLENTESGAQYVFFCSIHPGMKGTLVTQ